MSWTLGIIGGSGLYALDGLEDWEIFTPETPWGRPSDHLVRGRIGETQLVFLPRHGKGHRLAPSDIPYRANIAALKMAGCTDILSVSACGSLQEACAPGDVVAVDQFIDRTVSRPLSFFGEGLVAHVSIAEPVCRRLSALFRLWGADVIGMTNMPEARLAREAELPYATLAMVTDYDCWRSPDEAVTVTEVLNIMHQNSALARRAVAALALKLNETPRTPSPQGIENCLDSALITAADARDPELIERLRVIAGRVLAR